MTWRKVGEGSYSVFRKEDGSVWPWVVVLAVIGLIVLTNL